MSLFCCRHLPWTWVLAAGTVYRVWMMALKLPFLLVIHSYAALKVERTLCHELVVNLLLASSFMGWALAASGAVFTVWTMALTL